MYGKIVKPDAVTGLYYIRFGQPIVLREIILGVRCKSSPLEVVTAIENPAQDVTILRARPSRDRFEIIVNETVKPIVLKAMR